MWLCLTAAAPQAAFAALRVLITYRALELGLGVVGVGVVAALSSVLPAVIALPTGRLVDAGGARLTLFLSLVSVIAGGAAVALADGVGVLVVGSLLVGVGSVAGAVAGQGYASLASRSHELDTHFAVWSLSTNLGQVIGLAIVGLSDAVIGGSSHDPVSFAAWSVVVLVLCAVSALAGLPRVEGFAKPHGRLPLTRLLRQRGVPAALSASMVILAGVDLLVVYLPVLAEQEDISVQAVTFLLALRIGASIVARASLPRLLRGVRRDLVLVSSTLCSGLALVCLPLAAPSVVLMAGCLFAIGVFWGFGQPMTMTWVVSLVPRGEQGAILATRTVANCLASAAIPLAAGVIAGTTGVGGVFVLAGTLSLLVSRQSRRSLS